MPELMTEELQQELALIATQLSDVEGARCEVRSTTNQLYFVGVVQRYDGTSLTLVSADESPLPSVIYNTECKLIIRKPQSRTLFYSAKVRGHSSALWKVDQICINNHTESRAYFRQPVSLDAEAVLLTKGEQGETIETVYPCKVKDLSLEGAQIRVRARLERNDKIVLRELYANPEEQIPFFLELDICWADLIGTGEFLYGCRFLAVDPGEQDRLCAAIFALQRQDLQNRRKWMYHT